ncbi:unnamed protein product [Brassica rapa subsp. trilocularis]
MPQPDGSYTLLYGVPNCGSLPLKNEIPGDMKDLGTHVSRLV